MKKILIISSFILVLIAISTIGYNLVSASVELNEVQDIISIQEQKEVYLTPYGYTLDNPNIILNPYGTSPLTAIIIFETAEDVPVTITIEGKDINSTYTNKFESSKKHYLPIYGLYPNTINHIKIECGNESKVIDIETDTLPEELLTIESNSAINSNTLTLTASDSYIYAIDNNNDIRWYLEKNFTPKITVLENNHLLLNMNLTNNNLVEIDLLGKIYKQYLTDSSYLGTYDSSSSNIYLLSTNLLNIDKQTGTLLNTIPLDNQYQEAFYDEETNKINLSNKSETLSIDTKNNKKSITNKSNSTDNNMKNLSLYINEKNYTLTKGIKIDLTTETKLSDKTIFLIGYKEPNKTYDNYNIKIIKNSDNLQIKGNFNKTDEVYLILDKFLDKKIYNITSNNITINKKGLSGKYSIYLSINDTIYKTNNYIKF